MMGALLAFPRPFAKRPPQMSDGAPAFVHVRLKSLTPREPNGPLMAHVFDAETNELLKVDRVKPVDAWLKACGYRWVAGSQGLYTRSN